jgi:hypothetical protein
LVIEGGQELTIAADELGSAAPGDAFVLQILTEKEADLETEKLAHSLLNHILHEDSS